MEEINNKENIVEEENKSFDLKKEVLEWIETIVLALAIAFVIKGFFFDVVRVDGPSMENTLINNDRLIVTKIGYKPESQDIIILDSRYQIRKDYYAEEGKTDMNFFENIVEYIKLPESLKRKYYVKRIIGLPGQTVDIRDGKVYVDDKELEEDEYFNGYTSITDDTVDYPITVDDGCVFVMGDNRSQSLDSRSRSLGQVPIKAILGKATFRFFPLNTFGTLK